MASPKGVASSDLFRQLGGRRFRQGIHIPDDARRISGQFRMGRRVMSHHGARAHHGPFADDDSGSQRSVGADGSSALDHRPRILRRVLLTARKTVVGEGGVRADEHVVFHPQAIPQLDAALDGDAVPDDHVVFNEGVIADIAIPADAGAGKDVGVSPNQRPFANVLGLHQGGLVESSRQPGPVLHTVTVGTTAFFLSLRWATASCRNTPRRTLPSSSPSGRRSPSVPFPAGSFARSRPWPPQKASICAPPPESGGIRNPS